ncbi:MAG TPA: ATP-binding protein, partial [Chryseolinea sp.]|nr:ATP-binding protein [Chryseolinea sp.]
LEAKNRELESFNYVTSHDLKEPLRKIRNFIDVIRKKETSDTRIYLSKIDDSAKRMTDLIESILALSQVSNADLKFADVDLNEVLESCKSDLEVRLKESNAEITSVQLPIIKANESQLNQVFLNLIGNALKFCDTTPIIRINCDKVHVDEVDRPQLSGGPLWYWRLTFTDNGIGFDPQFKNQVFEPFQRLHLRNEYSGTGTGLSIVKKVIDRHNGFVDVDSEIGKGAKFTIWLPA